MKTKGFRLLTVLLAAVMLVALSLNIYAAQSNAVTQDGLTAQLFTDKDAYAADESVKAYVRVDNHTGKEVFIFTSINVPEGVTLAGGNTAYDALLQDGESWTSAEGTILSAGELAAAGSTATGDNMQIGFWVILTALAVCGMIALFVYGKNKKTWVSMLLCLAMVGGLSMAAVPVEAGDLSGTMEVSCPIQVDGKAAEVSAVVNYVIYDDTTEAGAAAPSETAVPTEAPTEIPTETPTETPTAAPTEAPTETPTAAPTAAPTETPTETPTEAPTEAPAETVDAEETGYYLVWEDFTNPYPNTWSDNIPSSWDAQVPAGGMQYVSTEGMKIASMVDESEHAEAILQREFNAVSGAVVWEFSLNATGDVTGAVVEMQSGDQTAISFAMNGTDLMLGETVIAQVPGGAELVGIKVELDTDTDTFEVIVDGQRINKVFNFEEACDSVNRMYLRTTETNVGTLGLSLVRVYTNLYVNEKFLVSTSKLPDDWSWNDEGTVNVVKKFGSVSPDIYSLKVTDASETTSTAISTDVTYTDNEAWLEYQFLIPEGSKAELAMVLATDEGEEFKVGNIYTEEEKYQFGYYNENGEFAALYDMIDDQWYHVLVKVTREGTLVYLNHKLLAEDIALPFLKFTALSFETSAEGSGDAYLDDILLKDYVDYPDDYVAEPELPEDDAYIVGMQACSLWKEGSHFGWDWISDWEERQSLLGLYDEMNPETADWEIKWMLEHSVDFELFCWYRPPSGADEPIKQPRNAYALEEAFFNAKYSDMMKFAISWENGSGVPVSGSEDFRENVVTYWIEQYFKDDRYMLVDNKPVVGIYNFADLKTQFGSVQGIKAEMDYLKQACIEAGFDGCIVLLTSGETATATLEEYAAAGIDCLYAYNWGPAVETQQDKMLAQSEAGIMDMMPTICMGRDDAAWERTAGSYLTDGEFRTLAEWVRDDFMPTLDEDSLGKRMVMIGNWNEYGEGHYVMPSNLNGFGYLDTLRAVFGDGDEEHTDVVPTETQRERINRMYIQDRVVPRTYTKETTDEIPTDVKLAWYFETAGDTEGWTVVKQVNNLAVADGAISGTSTGTDPGLISADNLNVAVGDVPYIKVRIKVDPVNSAQKLRVYFITTKDTTWNSTKNVKINFFGENNEYVEYLFDTSANTAWAGTIKQLRIDPLEEAGTFSIDSIELLQTPSDNEVTVLFEGEEIFTTRPVYVENEHVMFPAEELGDYISASWSKSLDGESLLLYINEKDYLTINYDTAEATLNGEAIEVIAGAMIMDGEHYFPLEVLEAVGYTVTWDKAAGTINVVANEDTGVTDDVTAGWPTLATDMDVPELPTGVEVIKAWYFNEDAEGWTNGGTTALTWKDGVLYMYDTSSNDPKAFSTSGLNIDTSTVSNIRIRVRTDIPQGKLKLYFTTTDDTTIDNNKVFRAAYADVTPGSDGYYTFDIATNELAAWNGTLDYLRITPASTTGKFYIDSVELLGEDTEVYDAGLKILVIGNSITQHNPSESKGWLADWGMAATCAENDYVHRLQTMAKELDTSVEMKWVNISQYEAYYYDWSKITKDYSEYEDFDADIIISTIGANINNAEPEEDGTYDSGQYFTKEHYKAIIDKFNKDGEAKVIVGTTIWVNGEIETAIKDAVNAYGYEFVSMNDLTDDQYRAAAYKDTMVANGVVSENVSSGVLNHPGDEGMRVIAERLWGKLRPMMVSMIDGDSGEAGGGTGESGSGSESGGSGETGGESGSGENEGGSGEGSGSTEMDVPALPENTQVKLGWYFDEDTDGWTEDANTTLIWSGDGTLKTNSTSGTTGLKVRSPENLNVAASDITYVRVRIKAVDAALSATAKLKLYFWLEGDTAELANQAFKPVYSEHTVGSDGYYTFDIACSTTANSFWTGTLSRLAIDPVGDKKATYYIDSVELLESTEDSVTGSDLDESLMSLSYTFTNDVAGSAKGTMTFAFGEQTAAEDTTVEFAWATGNATDGYTVLSDYTAIKTLTAAEAVAGYTIAKDMIIPETATALAATVTDNGERFVVGYDIPMDKLLTAEEPDYILGLASDFHFGGYGATSGPINQHNKALAHINAYADALVVNGDITQWFGAYSKDALDTLYDEDITNDNEEAGTSQWTIAANYFKQYTIPVYMVEGNHDTPSGAYPAGTPGVTSQRYKDYLSNWIEYSVTNGYYEDDIERESIIIDEETGAELATFYDDYVNGYHLIFLRVPYEGTYNPPEEELNWLDSKLYEYEESGKPIFVFAHTPYTGTVGHEDDVYTKQFTSEKFGEIIAKHPSVVVVSAHTHYTLDTDNGVSTINGEGIAPSFINDGGIISLRSADEAEGKTTFTESKGESMCVYAEIYDDKIITRGYDLIRGKWVSQGCYQIDLQPECTIAELNVTSNKEGDSITLTASSETENLTYQWYANGTASEESGASITVSSDFDGYLAVRATDSTGQYRSMSYNLGDTSDSEPGEDSGTGDSGEDPDTGEEEDASPTAGWPTSDSEMSVPALPVGTAVSKGWYFTDGTEDWTVGTGTSIIEKAGVLYLQNTTQDPVAYSPEELNINASEISTIRVRVRTDNPSGKLKVYFTTTTDSTINNDKRYAVEYAENMLGSDGYYTFDITTNGLTTWTGTIDKLRLTPSSQKNSNFYIDSVELLTTTSE